MESDQLKADIFKRVAEVNFEHLEFVLPKFKLEKHPKGSLLLKENQVSRKIYFICKGHVQVLYYADDLSIWTRSLLSDNQWCCSLESFIYGQPSSEEIVCLSDITAFSIDRDDFDQLRSLIPEFGEAFQNIVTELYLETNNRIQFVLSRSAKERIKWLYSNKIEYVKNYSSLLLASYLHLNKDVFGRLRPVILREMETIKK